MDNHQNEVVAPDAPAEKRKNKKTGKKSLWHSAVALYLTLALVALAVTFGWFTMNASVFLENETAGNMQIAVSAGDLAISLDKTTGFGEMISLEKPITSYFIDVSGNGEKLYFPKKLDGNDQPLFNQPDTFVEVTGDPDAANYYIEMRVYFQTTSKMDVYLSNSSRVTGAEDYLNDDNVRSFQRPSENYGEGKFSLDAIVGAARVAFLEETVEGEETTLTLKNVWIPNDNICLSYEDGIATLYETSEKRESLDGYRYLEPNESAAAMVEKSYVTDDYAYGRVSASTAQLACNETAHSNQAVPLLSFPGGQTMVTKTLIIRIWFEGTDREADKALNGGMAKYNLNFIGLDKEAPEKALVGSEDLDAGTTPGENEVGVYYNTELGKLCIFDPAEFNTKNAAPFADNKLTYSLDGIEWNSYSQTSGTQFTAGSTVYVRTAEDGEHKPGNVVRVAIP